MILRNNLKFTSYGKEYDVRLKLAQYAVGNRLRLDLETRVNDEGNEDGDPFWELFTTLTCNLPDEALPSDEMFVKNWSENEGADQWMIEQGIIMPEPQAYVGSGYVKVPRYKMTLAFYKEMFEAVLAMGLRGDFNVG